MPTILVAEDEPALAGVYAMLLSQWGCETVVEYTGTDAIHRAAAFQPDIALLGVVMPEMGGIEAGIKLLEICPGTKIVLVSEPVPPETIEQLEARGYHFATLPAPFTSEELHAVVFGKSCIQARRPLVLDQGAEAPKRALPRSISRLLWQRKAELKNCPGNAGQEDSHPAPHCH